MWITKNNSSTDWFLRWQFTKFITKNCHVYVVRTSNRLNNQHNLLTFANVKYFHLLGRFAIYVVLGATWFNIFLKKPVHNNNFQFVLNCVTIHICFVNLQSIFYSFYIILLVVQKFDTTFYFDRWMFLSETRLVLHNSVRLKV